MLGETLYLVVVQQGTWEMLYVNGEMLAEGHPLSAFQVIEALADVCPQLDASFLNIVEDGEMPFHLPGQAEWAD